MFCLHKLILQDQRYIQSYIKFCSYLTVKGQRLQTNRLLLAVSVGIVRNAYTLWENAAELFNVKHGGTNCNHYAIKYLTEGESRSNATVPYTM